MSSRWDKSAKKVLVSSAVISLLTTLILAGICAAAVAYGFVQEGNMGYYGLFVILMSAVLGGCLIVKNANEKKLLYSVVASTIYTIELASITTLFFGCEFSGIIVTVFVVFSGGLIPVILGKRARKERKSFYRKKHRG